jgi:hypothetical protein
MAGRTEAVNDTLLHEVPGVLGATAKLTSYKMYTALAYKLMKQRPAVAAYFV